MSQSLAKDFNFRSLLKFAFPSIIMMIFMSLYSIVDGFFIAQYVDSMALSAANIVYPAVSILLAVGIMFGTGGSAVVAAKIGQGKQEEANRNFSALTLTTLIIGILGAVLGNLFCRQICSLLGATPVLMDYGTAYLRTILSFAPVCLLQALFQSFFVTAGRPGLGLSLTVSAGITNMLLDYLFVVPLHLGVAGAALATGLGQCIPAVAGILYFTFARKGLRFTRPEFSKGLLSTSCCHLPFQHADAEIGGRNRCCRHHGDSVRTVSLCCAVPRLQYRRCTCVQLQLRQPEQTAADPALPHQYPLRCGKLCDHCTCGCLRLSGHFRRFHAERHVRL